MFLIKRCFKGFSKAFKVPPAGPGDGQSEGQEGFEY